MPQPTLDRVLDLDPTQHDVSVYLASLTGEHQLPTYREIQVTDGVLDDFRDTIDSVQQKYRRQRDDIEIVQYVGGATPESYQISWLDLNNHDFISDQIDSLYTASLVPQFDPHNQTFVENLQFYVIVVHLSGGCPIHFFRTYTPKKELRRSAYFAGLFRDGQFDEVGEPLFLFDRHLDCISQGDVMLVLKQTNFQRIFNFFEMVEDAARENLDRIRQAIPIDNFEAFAEACVGHRQKMFKLNNIASKDYLDRITMGDLRDVIDHHGLNVPITEQDGEEMLQFDAADRWEILRLLDDDYLESRMTGNVYEANSKREYGE
jgi:hypothetical protein